jgi:hypothetical protein
VPDAAAAACTFMTYFAQHFSSRSAIYYLLTPVSASGFVGEFIASMWLSRRERERATQLCFKFIYSPVLSLLTPRSFSTHMCLSIHVHAAAHKSKRYRVTRL